MTDNEGPPWFQAMSREDLGKLQEELCKLPDINETWYAAPGWCTYNPLGWAAFKFHYDLRIMQCVLDAGANPNLTCRLFFGHVPPILQYLEKDFDYLHESDDGLQIAQVLIKNGADHSMTRFGKFVYQQHQKNYAVIWCFANVLPLGAKDIAFDFLKRFEELPWGELPAFLKRVKPN
jgi:hypothetical protein